MSLGVLGGMNRSQFDEVIFFSTQIKNGGGALGFCRGIGGIESRRGKGMNRSQFDEVIIHPA